jgi:uncharacterized alpha-E superfamily protein
MLSRVAERLYWIGRYMERAENTARMVNTVTEMILGAPKQAGSLWAVMVEILGLQEAYSERYGDAEERHVVRFLLADEQNSSSVLCSLQNARENARTTREVLPTEAWELINDSYWQAKEQAARGVTRSLRIDFLRDVIERCQLFNGLLGGTMSHDASYDFTRLGRKLERADMTTRVLDLGIAGLASPDVELPADGEKAAPLSNIRWMSVLLCVSAYQMYHQHVQSRVNGLEVVRYLLLNPDFPRAVCNCINEVESCLRKFPRSEAPLETLQGIRATLPGRDSKKLRDEGLRDYLDELQAGFGTLHTQIAESWFTLEQDAAVMSQQQTSTTASPRAKAL